MRSHTRTGLVLLIVLLLSLSVSLSVSAKSKSPKTQSKVKKKQPFDLKKAIETKKAEIERLQKELERNLAEASRLKGREKELGSQVYRLDREVGVIETFLGKLRAEETKLSDDIKKSTESLEQKKIELAVHQTNFAKRLRWMYKSGRTRNLEILFSARSFPDFLRRYKFLSLVVKQDRLELEEIAEAKDAIEIQKGNLEADYQAKLELDRAKTAEEKRLAERKREREQALKTVQSNRKVKEQAAKREAQELAQSQMLLQRYMERYAEEQRKAEELRRKRERERQTREAVKPQKGVKPSAKGESRIETPERSVFISGSFTSKRGRLGWPVHGSITSTYGRRRDQRSNTWTFNRGIDIQVPQGSQVRAVSDGKVALVDWFRGYGKFLLLYHDGGFFTLYAHLSQVFVNKGDNVEAGQAVAASGDTGSLDGPKLHFEILKGKESLDPLAWLARK